MGVMDLFSKRQKRIRGQVPDVYQYEDIPNPLRVQIVHIVKDAFGKDRTGNDYPESAFKFIHESLCREYGVFKLHEYPDSDFQAVYDYFLKCKDYEKVIDVIELSFKIINTHVRSDDYRWNSIRKIEADDAIKELNLRFKEHGVGYQFESNEIIRVDSQYLHSEAVKPTLELLGREDRFKGANEEFLKAHEHYRHQRYKECLVDSLKALESVMKSICHSQKWAYNQNDTAKKLIDILFQKELIPAYLQAQFSSLRTLLESGVPTVRNKLGGHGQGAATITVTESLASYALHLSAANILLLARLEKENFC
ncbi:hypothetical protein L4X63_11005 [Geomonas sp. Red32]|uniref:STM4504/CBY_0614 family protein n=1 Tax=Geomonas sp. Red32 TaxID=2912856 RepID=UPI00202CA8E2|nr:hypothetical protein [Geomonas sp. Red32]MCM0082119.1 hypothetical protein [Geomonas sp. Red32]